MVNKCFVPLCDSGTRGANARYDGSNCPRPSTFKVTQDRLEEWRKAVPKRKDREMKVGDYICSRHFSDEEIIKYYEQKLRDGTIFKMEKTPVELAPGAVPHIFDGPKYLSRAVPKRKPPKSRTSPLPPVKKKKIQECNQTPPEDTDNASDLSASVLAASSGTGQITEKNTHTDAETMNTTDKETENVVVPLPTACPFQVKDIHLNPFLIQTPGKMWGVHSDHETVTVFSHLTKDLRIDKSVTVTSSLQPKVLVNNKEVHFPEIKSLKNLESLLQKVSYLRPCLGFTDEGIRSPEWTTRCSGFVTPGAPIFTVRCLECRVKRRSLQKTKKRTKNNKLQAIKLSKKLKASQQKIRRQKKKILSLSQQIHVHMAELKKVKKDIVEEVISNLPPEQQPLVRTCFNAANTKPRGRRYTIQWLYDTLLMKIQSPKLYRRLRRDNKLPLPSESTLLRLMKKVRPVYGFSENLFAAMKTKSSGFASEAEKHGNLLIDEMSLDEAVAFQKHSLKTFGFVDLGQFTPKTSQTKKGDHALVIMFQPYRGKWVQALAAFLSAGAVPGETLQKIILEAIFLLEKNGYFVDGVTTDGAAWNRVMWDLFGISKLANSCQHPVDPQRKLHFASDFPHLIKNLWVRIASKKEIDVPEGTVKLAHWEAVLREENKRGVKRGYTITPDHLCPTNYQKMNVPMAMKFFGNTLASAMESFRREGVPGLEDSRPTVEFVKRINSLVDAMNSQIPCEALRPDPESKHNKVLRDFIIYMEEMENMAVEKRKREASEKKTALEKAAEARKLARQKQNELAGKKIIIRQRVRKAAEKPANPLDAKKVHVGGEREITSSTFLGLWVTVRSALSLCDYLCSQVGFLYLMTRKISQDALEHFFGQIRAACGSNSHPDPLMFINVFRLLSTYSLVKPPRGSNVTGAELLNTLLSLKDLVGQENNDRRKELEAKLDIILDGGLPCDAVVDDHNYLEHSIDHLALTVLGGYVSRRLRSMKPCTGCVECTKLVCVPADNVPLTREELLHLKSYGGLLRPSDELFELLCQLESTVIKVTSNNHLHTNTFFSILDALVLSSSDEIVLLGCDVHKRQLTSAAITFYLTCRMHFICAEVNKAISVKKRRKNMAKMAKLIHSSETENIPEVFGIEMDS